MLRAASSVVLNLAEGSARATHADRLRFYRIALSSQRECTAILAIAPNMNPSVVQLCDRLGGHLYRLAKSAAPNAKTAQEKPSQAESKKPTAD